MLSLRPYPKLDVLLDPVAAKKLIDEELKSEEDISSEEKIPEQPQFVYIYKKTGPTKEEDQYYFLTEEECDDFIEPQNEEDTIFKISYSNYEKHHIMVTPLIDQNDTNIGILTADGGWQMACALTAGLIVNLDWDITTQIGFPICGALLAGALKAAWTIKNFTDQHGTPPSDEQRNYIIKEAAAFGTKIALSMGAWELGYFVGQCIINACSTTPFTFWIPVVLAISAGIFQGINAVATQIADEKRKYGVIKSSKFDLAKIFLTNFVGGAVWQLCSYIPFGSLLAKTVIKPVAAIVGSLLVGIATAMASYVVNKTVPALLNSTARLANYLMGPKPKPAPALSIGKHTIQSPFQIPLLDNEDEKTKNPPEKTEYHIDEIRPLRHRAKK